MNIDIPKDKLPCRVKVYEVPTDLSDDGIFVSIIQPGTIEVVPPSLVSETKLIKDEFLNEGDEPCLKL